MLHAGSRVNVQWTTHIIKEPFYWAFAGLYGAGVAVSGMKSP